MVLDLDGLGTRTVLDSSESLFEAPNWTPDGRWLVFNGEGRLFRIRADAAAGDARPIPIDSRDVAGINNDHVLSPDGRTIYLSNNDGHLYALPFEGGVPRRISNEHEPEVAFRYYLHGVSPDGLTLSYVGVQKRRDGSGARRWDLFAIPAAGGPDTRITFLDVPVDGPEFSPDGVWLYYNSEQAAARPGHAQLFRLRLEDGLSEQLTADERVNWFPHPSPDGRFLAYLSYPPGTEGHPADKDVILRTMPADGGPHRDLVSLFGGQGTMNVNSWSPDGCRLAYVEYPL
jgi:Tol biopolymer transport system component